MTSSEVSPQRCVVNGCKFNGESGIDDTVKFYAFPARASKPGDRHQRVKWTEFVRLSFAQDPKSSSSWTPSSTHTSSQICSSHFVRNCKSENPSKVNYAPTLFPEGLRDLPPSIRYDLRDLVCWWLKEGEKLHPTLLPIVECHPAEKIPPKPKKSPPPPPPRSIKTFTLVEIDVHSSPHPTIKTYIRVHSDLSFTCCLRDKPVPAHAILGEEEKTCTFASTYEFESGLERLMNLNLCVGISTAGLKRIPTDIKTGKIVTAVVDGRSVERLVSDACEVVAGIKVCAECKKLWNSVFKSGYCVTRKRIERVRVEVEQEEEEQERQQDLGTAEERLVKCERALENYKAEVTKLLGKNKELREKVLVMREALRQEQEGKSTVTGVKRKRKQVATSGGESDVEVVEEVQCTQPETEEPVAVPTLTLVQPNGSVTPKGTTQVIRLPVQSVAPHPNPQIPVQGPGPASTPAKPPQKVLKITREQALLLRKMTSDSTASGNVIRIQASQIDSIKKVLGGSKLGCMTQPTVFEH